MLMLNVTNFLLYRNDLLCIVVELEDFVSGLALLGQMSTSPVKMKKLSH